MDAGARGAPVADGWSPRPAARMQPMMRSRSRLGARLWALRTSTPTTRSSTAMREHGAGCPSMP
eukprot:11207118-Lingulodinium_polyedra.AAC.1